MNAREQRIEADVKKIRDLQQSLRNKVKLVKTERDKVWLEFGYRTVADRRGEIVAKTTATIEFSARYPMQEPKVVFTSSVFHPNVYDSGVVCLGTKWLATETLDFLVMRLIKILIFDVAILSTASPASLEALAWYNKKLSSDKTFFPTDTFSTSTTPNGKPKLKWGEDIGRAGGQDQETKTKIVKCTNCDQSLRVPDRRVVVTCPKCQTKFEVGL